MIFRSLKWLWRFALIGLLGTVLANCTMLGLNYASLETDTKPGPRPEITAQSIEQWQSGETALKADFEAHVFGPWPGGLPVRLVSRRLVDPDYAGGRGKLEELLVEVGEGEGAARFYLGLATPDTTGPHPLVIGQNFSPNCYVFAEVSLSDEDGEPCTSTDIPGVFKFVFGEFIARAPIEDWFEAGIAYASYYASDLVPDSRKAGPAAMAAMTPPQGASPTGTLMAWAYGYTAAIDVLQADSAIDPARIAVYGHSRHGKSALLAGVWDRRIAAVISHQSGYGGAALSRSTAGEGIRRITSTYPHWFAPEFGEHGEDLDALPVDQHQLLALLAPTPVFLGNARRDVWSDPNSTFRAAQAASTVYSLHGTPGLLQSRMTQWQPDGTIAYFLRKGGHGVDRRDMDAILDFARAQLQQSHQSAALN